MQEKPNSRWQWRPPVASQTFWRSPGGPPAAARMGSPGWGGSWGRPGAGPRAASGGGAGWGGGRGEGGRGGGGVPEERGGPEPGRVPAVHVDRGEPHLGVLEQRLGGGGEVGQARADGEDEAALAGQGVGGRGPLQPDAAQQPPVAVLDRALAGEGL